MVRFAPLTYFVLILTSHTPDTFICDETHQTQLLTKFSFFLLFNRDEWGFITRIDTKLTFMVVDRR